MRELGVWNRCRYPGYSDDPLDAFRCLAHDLTLAEDFLSGPAIVLRQAAIKQAAASAGRSATDGANWAGDTRNLERMRDSFREGLYAEVVELAGGLQYSELMTESQTRMVEIARNKIVKRRDPCVLDTRGRLAFLDGSALEHSIAPKGRCNPMPSRAQVMAR